MPNVEGQEGENEFPPGRPTSGHFRPPRLPSAPTYLNYSRGGLENEIAGVERGDSAGNRDREIGV
jgi:hypothetical protein